MNNESLLSLQVLGGILMPAGFFCANFVEGRVGLMIEYICIFCKKLSVVKFMTITFKYIFWDSLDAML